MEFILEELLKIVVTFSFIRSCFTYFYLNRYGANYKSEKSSIIFSFSLLDESSIGFQIKNYI